MSQPIDTAYVEIVPDVDRFAARLKAQLGRALQGMASNVDSNLRDVERSFARASDRIGGEGGRAGRDYGRQMAAGVRENLDGLFRDANGRLRDARGRFVAEGHAAGNAYGNGVVAGARRSLKKLDKVLGQVLGGATAAARALGLLTGGVGVAAAVATVSAALAGLASAAAGLVPLLASLTTALVTAAGAVAAIPGVIGAVVAVVGVLKLGLSGLKDAFKAVAEDDAEKLDEALKKLAPSARAFVKEIAKLKPAFDKLRLGVQERLFANTANTLKTLAASILPPVTAGFNAIAEAINRQVLAALVALDTQASRNAIAATFTAAATAVNRLGAALAPVGRALLNLVAVGAQVTAELSGGIAAAITEFSDKITALAASGGLKKIIEDGLVVLGQFAGLAGDLLGILRGIFSASGTAAGGGIFGFFDRLNTLVNRPDVQQALSRTFAALADLGAALTPVLVALLQALVPVGRGIGEIATAFAPILVTVLDQLGTALGSLAPGFVALGPLVAALGNGLQPLADILVNLVAAAAPGLTVLVDGLVAGLQALTPAAEPVGHALGQIATAIAPLLPALGAVLADALINLANAFAEITALAGPLITVLGESLAGAAAALLPVFLEISELALPLFADLAVQLTEALAPLVPAVIAVASAFAQALLPNLPALYAAFQELIPPIVEIARVFGARLAQALIDLIPHMPVLVAQLTDLALAGARLAEAIAPIVPPLVEFLINSGGLQATLLILGGTIELTILAFNGIAAVIERVTRLFGGAKDAADKLGSGVKEGFGSIYTTVKEIPGKITSALGSMASLLYGAGRDVIRGLINGISSMLGALKDKLASVTNLIPDWKGPLDTDRKLLVPTGQAIIEGLGAGMSTATADIRRQLRGLTGDIGLTVAAGAPAAGQAVVVNVGGVHFSGAVPTEQEAFTTGQAVGAGVADALARRSIRTAVRAA